MEVLISVRYLTLINDYQNQILFVEYLLTLILMHSLINYSKFTLSMINIHIDYLYHRTKNHLNMFNQLLVVNVLW